MNYFFVMIGGALGAFCRYGIGQMLSGIRFFQMPIGTITVNLIGCFLLGILTAIGMKYETLPWLSEAQTKSLLMLLTVGFCGAFTTFSTFSSETIKSMEAGLVWQSIIYALISVGVGLCLFWCGKHLI